MARQERKKEDLFIKPKRKAKNFFITSSAKMSEKEGINKTTISSSVFTKMSQSFAEGEYLLDDAIREPNASILYMLQEMQQDIDDVYNEVSASAFQASFFPFATIDSGSFGLISSSLIPDKDGKHHLGTPSREWENLHIDGTAHIDSLAMGTTVNSILDQDNMSSNSNTALATQQSIKKYVDDNAGSSFTATGISGSFTSLSASIATDIGNAGGGTIDSSLTNGSTNAVQNNAVYDGLALKLNLSGGTMTGLIQPIVTAVKSAPNKNTLDARATNVFQFNSKQAITIDMAKALYAGQEMTIVNLGQGAITITHQSKPLQTSFFIAGGSNLSIATAQVYKFVYTAVNQWLVIQ